METSLIWRISRRRSRASSKVVVGLMIFAFTAGMVFGVMGALAVERGGSSGQAAGAGEPFQLEGVREASTQIAAVDSQGNGLLCDLGVKVEPGEGDVFYRIEPYAQVDLQYSAETAVEVAAQMAGVDLGG